METAAPLSIWHVVLRLLAGWPAPIELARRDFRALRRAALQDFRAALARRLPIDPLEAAILAMNRRLLFSPWVQDALLARKLGYRGNPEVFDEALQNAYLKMGFVAARGQKVREPKHLAHRLLTFAL